MAPTRDDDLLLLNIFPSDNLTQYSLKFSQFNTQYELKRDKTKEKAFFYIGSFEVNMSLETITNERDVIRNYIVFTKGQSQPQAQLSVKAFALDRGTDELSYIHFLPTLGGEVTPAFFFQILNDVNSLFKELSAVYEMQLYGFGFPKI